MRARERQVFDAIQFLRCEPEIDVACAAHPTEVTLSVERLRSRFSILEQGRIAEQSDSLGSVVDRLHSRLLFYSVEAKPEAGILHAASLRRRGRRVLIAGPEGAGKTTLALRLIREGYELEGDEHVIVDCGGVVARPRACRVKESSLNLLSEFAEAISSAPFYVDGRGRKIFNVDPRSVGGSWCIQSGKVDRVIVLTPNHGGYSSLQPISATVLAQALLSGLQLRASGAGSLIAAVAGLVRHAKGYDLSLGDHDGAVECINRTVDE
jgi:hypothetical protein